MKNYALKNLLFTSVAIILLGACDFGTDDPDPENTAPTINNQSFSVSEEAEVDDVVGTVVASDSDDDDLTFTILSGNDGNAFSLSTSGEITVAAALDFNTKSEYTLNVEVSDGEDTASGDMTISVTEGSDPTPENSFVLDDEGYLIENARLYDDGPTDPNETNTNTHYAYYFIFTDGVFEDAISDDTKDMTYVLYIDLFNLGTSGWSPGTYTVGNSSGKLPWIYYWGDLNGDGEDDEGDDYFIEKSGTITVSQEGSVYSFEIDAVLEDEDGVASDRSMSGTFSVDVTPITGNENSPPSISDQTFSVDENSANGNFVGTVSATDVDSNPISYFIESGNTDEAFAINESTGELTVNNSAALDYETIQVIELMVRVTDGEGENQALITVNINDVDEGGSGGDFTYSGNDYSITASRLIDQGVNDNSTHYDYYFVFTDGTFDNETQDFVSGSSYVLTLDLLDPGTDGWSAGTFTVGNTDGKYPEIYVWRDLNQDNNDDAGDEYYIEKSGTVTVSVDGNTYTFTIDAILEDEDGVAADKNISGSFSAELTPVTN